MIGRKKSFPAFQTFGTDSFRLHSRHCQAPKKNFISGGFNSPGFVIGPFQLASCDHYILCLSNFSSFAPMIPIANPMIPARMIFNTMGRNPPYATLQACSTYFAFLRVNGALTVRAGAGASIEDFDGRLSGFGNSALASMSMSARPPTPNSTRARRFSPGSCSVFDNPF
jgi:hypothetical protein